MIASSPGSGSNDSISSDSEYELSLNAQDEDEDEPYEYEGGDEGMEDEDMEAEGGNEESSDGLEDMEGVEDVDGNAENGDYDEEVSDSESEHAEESGGNDGDVDESDEEASSSGNSRNNDDDSQGEDVSNPDVARQLAIAKLIIAMKADLKLNEGSTPCLLQNLKRFARMWNQQESDIPDSAYFLKKRTSSNVPLGELSNLTPGFLKGSAESRELKLFGAGSPEIPCRCSCMPLLAWIEQGLSTAPSHAPLDAGRTHSLCLHALLHPHL